MLKDAAAQKFLKDLREYKKAVDNFYLNETVIQRRLDVEENPRKFIKKFFEDLQKIILSCEKFEERIFLKNWGETLAKYFQSRIIKQAN